jgi:hypothetical protein
MIVRGMGTKQSLGIIPLTIIPLTTPPRRAAVGWAGEFLLRDGFRHKSGWLGVKIPKFERYSTPASVAK